MSLQVTKHGEKRSRERLGINKKAVDRNAQKALQFGLRHNETKGGLRRFLDKCYLSYQYGNNSRVYHRNVYIFEGNLLITMFPLPKKFFKVADELESQKEIGKISEES